MKVQIYGNGEESKTLLERVKIAIDDLGMGDFVSCEAVSGDEIKQEFSLTKEPALIIEEEIIQFRDMIFEGIVPEIDDLKSMFISIIGAGEGSGGGCDGGSCGSGCSC